MGVYDYFLWLELLSLWTKSGYEECYGMWYSRGEMMEMSVELEAANINVMLEQFSYSIYCW